MPRKGNSLQWSPWIDIIIFENIFTKTLSLQLPWVDRTWDLKQRCHGHLVPAEGREQPWKRNLNGMATVFSDCQLQVNRDHDSYTQSEQAREIRECALGKLHDEAPWEILRVRTTSVQVRARASFHEVRWFESGCHQVGIWNRGSYKVSGPELPPGESA